MSEGLTMRGRPVRGIVPLPTGVPVECQRATTIVPVNAATALSDERGWEGLDSFVAIGLELLGELVEHSHQLEAERLRQLAEYEDELRVAAYTELGSVLDGSGAPPRRRLRSTDHLLGACRVVAGAAGIELVEPPDSALESVDDQVAAGGPLLPDADPTGGAQHRVVAEPGRTHAGPAGVRRELGGPGAAGGAAL